MANYTTSSDLKTDALDRAQEPTDGTSDFDSMALRFLNRAYQEVWTGGGAFEPGLNETWWWLRKEASLILQPRITSGTVSVTHDSASITFSSSIATDLAGYHFKVDGFDDVFKIATHGGATDAATLDSVYTGATDGTAGYTAFKVDYDLASDVMHLFHPMHAQRHTRKITLADLDALHEAHPLTSIESGVPENFAMTAQRTVRFSHYGPRESDELIRVDYDYLFEPADLADDSSEPVVPRQYRKVLSDMTTMFLLAQKNDDRADGVGRMARAGLRAMARENRRRWALQGNMGQILPRDPRHPTRPESGPPRTSSGLILG